MRILNLNCQGYRTVKRDVVRLVDLYDVDIVCLSETWETPDIPVTFRDWPQHSAPRIERRGGGLSVIFKPKSYFEINRRISLEPVDIEVLCAAVRTDCWMEFLLIVVYIPPEKTRQMVKFLEFLKEIYRNNNGNFIKIVLTGDFNAKSLEWGNIKDNQFGRLLKKCLLDCEIFCVNDYKPTRRQSTSVIDLFLLNWPLFRVVNGCRTLTQEIAQSDHIAVLLDLNIHVNTCTYAQNIADRSMDIKGRRKLNICKILDEHKEGSTREYDVLLNELENPELESSVLASYLRSFRDNISRLDKKYEILVGVTLNLNCLSREQCVVQEFQSYLLNLVSAHTYYLKAVLRMLIRQFIPKFPRDQLLDEKPVDEELRGRYMQIFSNVHKVLRAINSIVPMAPIILLPLLTDMYPYMTLHIYVQESYARNLLTIISYMPGSRQQILDLVVDKMLKLDVRAPRHAIQAMDSPDDDMDEDIIFEMEDTKNEPTLLGEQKDMQMDEVKPMTHMEADKLDTVMDLVFQYINNVCYENGELNWNVTKKLYREFLLVFERKILPTHASAHVQFIMFYLCSLRQEICEGFLDYLWKKVQDPSTPPVFRMAAISYLASLLSRATFVPISTLTSCLDLICKWIHRYLDQTTQEIHADIVHHGTLYTVCQAVFYTFLFRNEEIMATKRGHKFAESLNFQRIITCRLNPLRVCQPYIVKSFASVTRMYQLAFCDTIIERNNRCRLPVAAYGGAQGGFIELLEPFFPFDPYLLSKSGSIIRPLQRQYQGPDLDTGSMKSDDEDDNDDDFLINATRPQNVTSEISTSLASEKSLVDFMDFGTSPGFYNSPVS
ncbi:hypothetical protein ScPMuIL_003921 [Solemya velum]